MPYAEDGTWVPDSFYGPKPAGHVSTVRMADGSRVPLSQVLAKTAADKAARDATARATNGGALAFLATLRQELDALNGRSARVTLSDVDILRELVQMARAQGNVI